MKPASRLIHEPDWNDRIIRATAAMLSAWLEHPAGTERGFRCQRITETCLTPLSLIGEAADAIIARGPPDQRIGAPGRIYLERWWLERGPRRSVYLHRYIGDDPRRDLHDHPADSASLMLRGALLERWLPRGSAVEAEVRRQGLGAGTVTYRPAEHAHQLETWPLGAEVTAGEQPLTLFVFGPRRRRWGFWVPARDGRRFELAPETPTTVALCTGRA